MTRRAEQVSRPGSPNSCRRRVFVVTMPSPRPTRVVHRARLWAITCTASHAPLAANLPDRQVLEPDPLLEVPEGVLDLVMAAMVGLELEGLAVPVGEEGVVVVEREAGRLGTRRRPDAAHDEAHCEHGDTLLVPQSRRVAAQGVRGGLERETGFEPATSSLEGWRSTN